jgi:hypothetical protein
MAHVRKDVKRDATLEKLNIAIGMLLVRDTTTRLIQPLSHTPPITLIVEGWLGKTHGHLCRMHIRGMESQYWMWRGKELSSLMGKFFTLALGR